MIQEVFKCFNNLNPNMMVLFALLLFTICLYLFYKIYSLHKSSGVRETIEDSMEIQKEVRTVLSDVLHDVGAMNAVVFLFHNGKKGMHLDIPFFYFSPYSEVRTKNAPSMFKIHNMPIGAVREHIVDAAVSHGIYIGGGDVFVWSEDLSTFDSVAVAILTDMNENIYGFLLLTFCDEYENSLKDNVEYVKSRLHAAAGSFQHILKEQCDG